MDRDRLAQCGLGMAKFDMARIVEDAHESKRASEGGGNADVRALFVWPRSGLAGAFPLVQGGALCSLLRNHRKARAHVGARAKAAGAPTIGAGTSENFRGRGRPPPQRHPCEHPPTHIHRRMTMQGAMKVGDVHRVVKPLVSDMALEEESLVPGHAPYDEDQVGHRRQERV